MVVLSTEARAVNSVFLLTCPQFTLFLSLSRNFSISYALYNLLLGFSLIITTPPSTLGHH